MRFKTAAALERGRIREFGRIVCTVFSLGHACELETKECAFATSSERCGRRSPVLCRTEGGK
jgi:hypothetical protein